MVHLPYDESLAAEAKELLTADLEAPVSMRALAFKGIILSCGYP